MLYKKNTAPSLSEELFRRPTGEYRATPFWAWNSKLNMAELERQIDIFREMGLGGFHMHVRTGMATDYLSDNFMELIKGCVEKAKENEMLAWLYDEDRWPSGAAGGLVTKDEKYRARCLLMTVDPCENSDSNEYLNARAEGSRNGNGYLICCYDIELDENGFLKSYCIIDKDAEAKGVKWYAYLKIHADSPWYNNQAYLNTLDKKAVQRFIEVTHERYKEVIGSDFSEAVPAIFTDEPQFTRKKCLQNSTDTHDIIMPWTDDFPDTFKEKYGIDILDFLPEIFWELPDGKVSAARYRYHDHISERFADAFADTCGKWCDENNLPLTGHMMEEPTLKSQTAALGDTMRSYRSFGIPGIDMLCANFEFTTAKQAQSAVHQYGREGMLSELYGVTGWDYDFRGYKLHGDWQAALGVTVRVPHLSWYAMGGEAKRDYPASIHYQSPWYREFSYLEDHFARINTAMTRGKPVVKVGVIHPIESYWLHWGPDDKTDLIRENMDKKFLDMASWLLKGSIDFDYICESLLPYQCESGSSPLRVGKMEYNVVIVPDCEMLRSTTLERLEQFKENGGKLIFMGSAPAFSDGVPSDRGKILYEKSQVIPFDREKLLSALEKNREVCLRLSDGRLSDGFIHQLRQDGDCRWLFISRCREPYNKDVIDKDDMAISVKGIYSPVEYNTLTGETHELPCKYTGDNTIIRKTLYNYDSLLIKLNPGKSEQESDVPCAEMKSQKKLYLHAVPYTLSEENALLLDMAEYSVDGGDFSPAEEILRLDNICREKVGLKERGGAIAQPWVVGDIPAEHKISLRFKINSEIDYEGAHLALEDAEKAEITFNGQRVENLISDFYVDRDIKKVPLPNIVKGENILTVTLPLGERTNTEWCYILGNFGVKVSGCECTVIPLADKLTFGSILSQGLPFYGGNITYHLDVPACRRFTLEATKYRGALMSITVDGKKKRFAYPPYKVEFEFEGKAERKVDLTLFGNRYNGFGPVHLSDEKHSWHGPGAWRSEGFDWSCEYVLRDIGILSSPIVKYL